MSSAFRNEREVHIIIIKHSLETTVSVTEITQTCSAETTISHRNYRNRRAVNASGNGKMSD